MSGEVASLHVVGDWLAGVRMANGTGVPREALLPRACGCGQRHRSGRPGSVEPRRPAAAAAQIDADLVAEETRRAVAASRAVAPLQEAAVAES